MVAIPLCPASALQGFRCAPDQCAASNVFHVSHSLKQVKRYTHDSCPLCHCRRSKDHQSEGKTNDSCGTIELSNTSTNIMDSLSIVRAAAEDVTEQESFAVK